MIRGGVAAVVLAALLYAGFRPIGPMPPLGPLLDPANGVWANAAATTLPPVQSIAIPGLVSPVRVMFDDRGVPHIFAENESDAYRALGFVVARDRLFQMETQTRAAAGRLTEWAGERLLEADRESRALGLAWSAEKKLAAYGRDSRGYEALAAYAEGVNAWIAQMRPRDLPVEYRLLNASPIRWEPIHSLYFVSRMSVTLGLNDETMRRLRAQALVGSKAADALFPVNSPIQEPIQPNGSTAPRFDFVELPVPATRDKAAAAVLKTRELMLASLGHGAREDGGDAIGSNNWAVAPSRAANGHALLAGDPHLELTLPSVWYEMHIVVPGRLDVAGAGFPGVPGVVIGFNRDVAWTFTNTGSDVNDFYRETVDDSVRPSRYLLDGRWRQLEKRIEQYRDKRGNVIAVDTLYFTHRGPMRRQVGMWLSMRWTAHDESREPDNFMSLGAAKNVSEWMDAMRDYVAPTQNGLVADRAGNIAIRSSGRFPVRPADGRGDLVRDGSKSASDWRGTLPVASYPFAFNPSQGYLASANQQPVDPRQNSAYMGSNWVSPWRAIRINSLLKSNRAVTPEDMRLYQTDPGSARADAFVAQFLAAAARADSAGRMDDQLRRASTLLSQWDRRYTTDSDRAVLFESAMEELALKTWDELSDSTSEPRTSANARFPEGQILLGLMEFPKSVWWDDRRTPSREDRDAIINESLRSAYAKLLKEKGKPDSDGWAWQKNRHANINHLLRMRGFSSLAIPVQSGPGTLSPSNGSGTHGASWRMVVELGPEVRAWSVYPGGQSGAPASSRYRDRISRWRSGQLDQVLFPRQPEDLDRKRVISTLTLRPL